MSNPGATRWALILGASSGFGAATALELAKAGINIFGVHLDRKQTQDNVKRVVGQIEETGRVAVFFNTNAADDDKRESVLDTIAGRIAEEADGYIHVLLHSLAFGALRPFISDDKAEQMQHRQLDMTMDVMANSLVYWTQGVLDRNLMRDRKSKLFAMTSAGSARMWRGYGAVSAAKCALESHIRQLAYELAPRGIAANTIRAGVTDTPALRQIPGHEEMLQMARDRNPGGRPTQPEDVARAIRALAESQSEWLTGNVIAVDGGEFNVG